MWRVAKTVGGAEFEAAQELRFETFLPYTREKVRVKLPTRGRALFKAEVRNVVRWPRYLFVRTDGIPKGRSITGVISFGGEPAAVSDAVVNRLRQGCDETGRIVRPIYLVGDILKFIAPSPLVGLSGAVLSTGEHSVSLSVLGRLVSSPLAEVVPIA